MIGKHSHSFMEEVLGLILIQEFVHNFKINNITIIL